MHPLGNREGATMHYQCLIVDDELEIAQTWTLIWENSRSLSCCFT